MLLRRSHLVRTMIGCALAALCAGCSTPWNTPPTFARSAGSTTPSPTTPPLPAVDAEPDLASIFDELAQIRAIDPAAEQKLLDELRRHPPKLWPLMAEQFRASLAYREQLRANKQPTNHAATEPAHEPPSALLGTLVDPRTAYADRPVDQRIPPRLNESMQPPATAPTAPQVEAATHLVPARPSHFAVEQANFASSGQSAEPQLLKSAARGDDSAATPISETLTWQQHLERAADELSDRVAAAPATTAEIHQHVSLRVLRLLVGDTERALQPIPNIPPAEQDYWSRQIFALATYLDHHSQPDDKRRAAASVTHLDEAVSHLREVGSLALRNLAFCKNVHGYGAIETHDSDRFSPGDQVLLYVEVENYHSRSTDKGFSTLLGSSYEVLNDKGERLTGGDFPDVEDYCRSRRRDFHIQYGLTLPASLAPGHYRLQVVVKDRQSDKIGSASVGFEIRGNQL